MKEGSIIIAVIALLKGIDVDGETMEHIIHEVGMTDQMKSQLGITSQMPNIVINQIAEDIYIDLDNEGADIIEEQEYGICANEIVLESIDLDEHRVKTIVKDVLRSHFKPME
jgi:hypothetical protein